MTYQGSEGAKEAKVTPGAKKSDKTANLISFPVNKCPSPTGFEDTPYVWNNFYGAHFWGV